MEKVRIGIIGLGNMGTGHAKYLVKNEVKGAELTAICEFRADRLSGRKKTQVRTSNYSTILMHS